MIKALLANNQEKPGSHLAALMLFVRKNSLPGSIGPAKWRRNGPLRTSGKALIFLENILGYVWKVEKRAQVWVDPGVKGIQLQCCAGQPAFSAGINPKAGVEAWL